MDRLYFEWMKLKCDVLHTEIKLLLLKAGFNPDQPRVPAGNPDGGQWSDGGWGSSGSFMVVDAETVMTDAIVDNGGVKKPAKDIDATLNLFRNNPGLGTSKDCAAKVRIALNRAGFNIQVPKGHSTDAKDYGDLLENADFSIFKSERKPSIEPLSKILKPGDVAIMESVTGSTAGHIQIYDGIRWYPRFPKDEFWPGPNYRRENPSYKIYRYYGWKK